MPCMLLVLDALDAERMCDRSTDIESNFEMRRHCTYRRLAMTNGSLGEDDPDHTYTRLDRQYSS
jgi:hypothetical protein